jgi:hypothetical protein
MSTVDESLCTHKHIDTYTPHDGDISVLPPTPITTLSRINDLQQHTHGTRLLCYVILFYVFFFTFLSLHTYTYYTTPYPL